MLYPLRKVTMTRNNTIIIGGVCAYAISTQVLCSGPTVLVIPWVVRLYVEIIHEL